MKRGRSTSPDEKVPAQRLVAADGDTEMRPSENHPMPRKRFYRQRAHANPFSDHQLLYPATPNDMDWQQHFPAFADSLQSGKQVEFADIGCGFGGLLMALAPMYPDTLMLGMEIRVQVTQYVADKITALRATGSSITSEKTTNHNYSNVSVVRANAMKFLPNFFRKGQLSKIFFLFPDPHFKNRKHKARIISTSLLAEYAYVLKPGGLLYTVTDVHDLFLWEIAKLDGCPLFQRVPDEDMVSDPVLKQVRLSTEEGKKVERNAGEKWHAVYRRVTA